MTQTRNLVAAAIEDAKDAPQASTPFKESQASAIVRLARECGGELWHTRVGDGYISIPVESHLEHYQLNSRGCKDYLTRLYYRDAGKAPKSSALQDALATLSGIARFDGAEHEAPLRVATNGRNAYLDLCDEQWRAIEISEDGWRVTPNPPVRFRRPRGVLSLPVPMPGGSIADLRAFVNVETDEDFALLVMWQLAALRARGPYPILVFMAEQGAAKTTTTRVLRRLVDPNESDVRRPPRNTEDLMIAATNGHVVAFDNLSRLPEDLSDNLSVLATGGGFAVRQLYTNAEEQIFQAQRPIIMNGISQVATRGDLLDRAIIVTLPTITEERREDEATFWLDFDAAQPRILGALLTAVSVGLSRVADVRLERKPRMADFALWAVAVEPACPWREGMFLHIYSGNRQGAIEATLEGDPVVDVVRALVNNPARRWQGTASDLLAELNQRAPEDVKRRKDWFSRARQVSDSLRRLAPGLRKTAIEVTLPGRHNREPGTGRRVITLERIEPENTDSVVSRSSRATPAGDSRGVIRNSGRDSELFSSQPGSSRPDAGIEGSRDPGDERDAQGFPYSDRIADPVSEGSPKVPGGDDDADDWADPV